MNDVEVRAANTGDSSAIARLLGQLGYPANPADVPGRIARMHSSGTTTVLVATIGARVVGLATSHVLTVINRAGNVAQLTALVVDEAERQKGVGRALVAAVEKFARESGCERLTVTTYHDRAGAHAFYERIGFELTGRRYGKMLPD